jgi:hypothetical protein
LRNTPSRVTSTITTAHPKHSRSDDGYLASSSSFLCRCKYNIYHTDPTLRQSQTLDSAGAVAPYLLPLSAAYHQAIYCAQKYDTGHRSSQVSDHIKIIQLKTRLCARSKAIPPCRPEAASIAHQAPRRAALKPLPPPLPPKRSSQVERRWTGRMSQILKREEEYRTASPSASSVRQPFIQA